MLTKLHATLNFVSLVLNNPLSFVRILSSSVANAERIVIAVKIISHVATILARFEIFLSLLQKGRMTSKSTTANG